VALEVDGKAVPMGFSWFPFLHASFIEMRHEHFCWSSEKKPTISGQKGLTYNRLNRQVRTTLLARVQAGPRLGKAIHIFCGVK
jgi:hypothetical protein